MKKLVYILMLLILSLIEKSFLGELFGAFSPNLILALAFALGSSQKYDLALFTAFFGGLFVDLASFNIFGLTTFTYTVGLFLSSLIKKYVFKGLHAQFFMLFLVYLTYQVVLTYVTRSHLFVLNFFAGFVSTFILYLSFYILARKAD